MRFHACLLILILCPVAGYAQTSYEQYFIHASLRFDYILAGNSDTATAYYSALKKEPFWGGSKVNLIDSFNYGDYFLKVFDLASGKLIYSHGYSDLFREWQSTAEARQLKRAFSETVLMPYPRSTVKIEILRRNKDQNFSPLYQMKVDPEDMQINRDTLTGYPTEKIIDSGDPAEKVDIVFIPEGYTQEDMNKFRSDALRFAGYMLSWSPFSDFRDKFNFWIVKAPSADRGTDFPDQHKWNRTAVNSNFYTFGTNRYLTTQDVFRLRDIAAHAPYDQICILVNTERYGGGGVYNFYNLCTADNKNSEFVFCHEFGHAFAALADEYVEPGLETSSLHNLKAEPYEPNITTLVHFEKKWKAMLPYGTLIPTPEKKENAGKLGVYEGAGYLVKGIYRPDMDCSMRSVINNAFCPVCKEAIREMIFYYAK